MKGIGEMNERNSLGTDLEAERMCNVDKGEWMFRTFCGDDKGLRLMKGMRGYVMDVEMEIVS